MREEITQLLDVNEKHYKFGKDKFIIVEKKFEDWVKQLKRDQYLKHKTVWVKMLILNVLYL